MNIYGNVHFIVKKFEMGKTNEKAHKFLTDTQFNPFS